MENDHSQVLKTLSQLTVCTPSHELAGTQEAQQGILVVVETAWQRFKRLIWTTEMALSQ
jgi:hypothetical protein